MNGILLPAAQELRRFRLPHSGRDWGLLAVAVAIGVGLSALLKHFFPEMNTRLREIIAVIPSVIILIACGYGSN